MSETGERTEDATPKRMKEVYAKGQLTRSQDLTAWIGIGAAAALIPLTIEIGTGAAVDQAMSIRTLILSPNLEVAVTALDTAMASLSATLTPMLIAVFIVVLVVSVAQGGVHVKKVAGNFEQFNLVKGIGRTFGGMALWGGVKALAKTAVVCVVLYLVIQGLMPILTSAGGLSVAALTSAAAAGSQSLLQSAVAAGLVLAIADAAVVLRRNRKKTRMTKQEVKDENKSSEGDPLIKQQRRSRQFAMSRNRMMAAIADADVVLINPTHFAIALSYEPGKSAPRIVAKGAGLIAARIREQAETDRVPIVCDIPLTRALHAQCELGEEIPLDLYSAVASVLAFVMSLTRRGSAQGTHTMTAPGPVPVPEGY